MLFSQTFVTYLVYGALIACIIMVIGLLALMVKEWLAGKLW